MGEVLLDPFDRAIGEVSDIAVVSVQQLVGGRCTHSGVTYAAVMPPSMINDWPVIQLDSLEARNSAPLAISVGSPNLPMGMCTRRRLRLASSDRNLASSGVMIGPGHNALARIPWRA